MIAIYTQVDLAAPIVLLYLPVLVTWFLLEIRFHLMTQFPIWMLILVLILINTQHINDFRIGILIFSCLHRCLLRCDSELQTPCFMSGFLFPHASWHVCLPHLNISLPCRLLLFLPCILASSSDWPVTCQFLSR